jgi:Ca-activated chloride channel family protein
MITKIKNKFFIKTLFLIIFTIFIINSSLIGEQIISNWKNSGSVKLINTNNLKPEKINLNDKKGWKLKIPGGRALATPAVVDKTIYVGGGFGSYEFYAFNGLTGNPVWAESVSDDGPTAAVVQDNYVAFNTESCTLFVVDSRNGKMIWSKWLGDPLMSQPAISKNTIFMAYPKGQTHVLIAIELSTGKELWEVPIAGDIISSPVIYKDSIYLSTFDGTVYRYNFKNGKLLWKNNMNATSAPWIEDEQIFVSKKLIKDNKPVEGIVLLNKERGNQENKSLWGQRMAPYLDGNIQNKSTYNKDQKKDDASVGFSTGPSTAKLDKAYENIGQSTVRGLWEYQGSRPIFYKGRLYTTFGDAVSCIDPKTEKIIWEKRLEGDLEKLGGHLATPPSLAGEKIYIGTTTGWLLVYNIANGSLAWKVNIGESIRYQPAVSDGWIYLGTDSGTLYGINAEDPSATGWNMWGGSASHNGNEN